jgi:hypothetical protein
MKRFFGNPFVEWLVFVVAIMGGIVAVKFLLGYLPDSGIAGGVKQVGMMA